jgi:hypothetical protein
LGQTAWGWYPIVGEAGALQLVVSVDDTDDDVVAGLRV